MRQEEVANFVAHRLGLERTDEATGRTEYALRFDTKSTTTARDLFYSFDTVGRFHAAQSRANVEALRFLTFHAFGRAILDACPASKISDLLGPRYSRAQEEPRRSVVLIDEVDKAPRDVPNDLLRGDRPAAVLHHGARPGCGRGSRVQTIVVTTSNSERALPDEFLRRCVFFAMPFPEPDLLRDIVADRVPDFPREDGLLGQALNLFKALRVLVSTSRPARRNCSASSIGWRS